MEKISATEAKNNFGLLIDKTRNGPVLIEKQGRPSAIILSPDEYFELEKISDLYWALKAEIAERNGYLSIEESEEFLKNLGA